MEPCSNWWVLLNLQALRSESSADKYMQVCGARHPEKGYSVSRNCPQGLSFEWSIKMHSLVCGHIWKFNPKKRNHDDWFTLFWTHPNECPSGSCRSIFLAWTYIYFVSGCETGLLPCPTVFMVAAPATTRLLPTKRTSFCLHADVSICHRAWVH